jgi:hypothetical protein
MGKWQNYDRRFETHKEEMRELVAKAAETFGAEVIEETDSDKGFSFAVERSDGRYFGVSLVISDSGDADDEIYDVHGNFAVRFERGDESWTFGPGNYTDDCWANYDDDGTWRSKLDKLRQEFAKIPVLIEEWQAAAGPKPGL